VPGSGAFTFPTKLANMSNYDVTVLSSGLTQSCTATGGQGAIAGANVTTVSLSCSATKARFAYIPSGGASVTSYGLDGTTGALMSPLSAGGHLLMNHIALNPAGTFAYATDFGNANTMGYNPGAVVAYAVNAATGALTELAGSPYAAPNNAGNPDGIVVDPLDRFVYSANDVGNTVSGYTINAATGALTSVGAPVIVGTSPGPMAIDGAGKYLYVGNENDTTISAFAINAATGVLTPVAGSPFTLPNTTGFGGSAHGLEVASNGLLYVSDYWGAVDAFTIGAAGGLTLVTGGSLHIVGQSTFQNITVNAGSTRGYMASYNTGAIVGFSIAASGVPSQIAGSPFSGLVSPNGVVLHPSGNVLYTANWVNQVAVYAVAPSGVLTQIVGSPFTVQGDATSITITP